MGEQIDLTPPERHANNSDIKGDYHFTESGLNNVWLRNWPLMEYEGRMVPLLPDPDWFERVIISRILEQSEGLNGDDILFLRKHALHLRAKQLAESLGVSIQMVNRWERDRDAMPPRLQSRLKELCTLAEPLSSELAQ